MKKVLFPELKHAEVEFNSPENYKEERYVVSDPIDLYRFYNHPEFKSCDIKIITDPILKFIKDGEVVILTDRHPMSGFPTYQHLTDDIKITYPEKWS